MDVVLNDNRWNLLQSKVQERQIARVFSTFNEAGLSPILIKGYAAGLNYPENISRSSVDIDLSFSADEFDVAKMLYSQNRVEGAFVDFHDEFDHLDSLPWETLFERTELRTLDGVKIRLLSPEDHLRIMCVHWLVDGGERKDKLWDIYYAVENRKPDFDWGLCLGGIPENRRQYVEFAIGVAHIRFGLDISDLSFRETAENVPKWVLKVVSKAWKDDTQLVPLRLVRRNRKQFVVQLRKRVPPNAITATVLEGGNLDSPIRFHYQIRNMVRRTYADSKKVFKRFLA